MSVFEEQIKVLKEAGKNNPAVSKWKQLQELCRTNKISQDGIAYLVNYYINTLQWSELQAVDYAISLFENGTIEKIKFLGGMK